MLFDVFNDCRHVFMLLHHFLMLATALFIGTSTNRFTHDSRKMPFATVLLTIFEDVLKFNEELQVLLIFLRSPF